MIFLVLAILSSTLISVAMRLSEGRIKSRMLMFFSNYVLCTILSLLYSGSGIRSGLPPVISMPVLLGLVSGILYLAGFLFFKKNISVNGMVLSSTFMKLGVIVPTLMAFTLFGERPSFLRILGIMLAILSIIFINTEGASDDQDKTRRSGALMLVTLLLVSGINDSMAGIFSRYGDPGAKDFYLLFTFGCAGLFALVLFLAELRKGSGISVMDVLLGALIGIPNYYCSRFLLLSLGSLDAALVYPAFSVGTIILITLVGALMFKEKLSYRKALALGLISVSLVLLNIT